MKIFSKFLDRLKTNLEKDFDKVKKSSIIATLEVNKAQQALHKAIQEAADLAEEARAAAEAAANDAVARSQHLAQEAKSAAERAEYHRSLLSKD
jgi:phage shock protein A